MKGVTLRLADDFHKRLKLRSVEEDTTMQDYVFKAVQQILDRKESGHRSITNAIK